MSTRIFDCFIFNDEIDILHERFMQYQDVVDGFLIAESRHSFDGNLKPLWAHDYLVRNPLMASKVKIIEYHFPKSLMEAGRNDRWGRERYARESLSLPISRLPEDSYVILSDVDEFPSISQISNAISLNFISSALTPVVIGKVNLFSESDANWNTVRIGPKNFFRDLNSIRYMKAPKALGEPGIHLTWLFGNLGEFLAKVRTTAHSEFDRDPKLIQDIVAFSQKYQVSHLGRFHRHGHGLLKFIPQHLLSQLQISLLESRPDWYAGEPVIELRWKRFCASFLISEAWKTGKHPSDEEINLCTFVIANVNYFSIRLKILVRRVSRKLTKVLTPEN